MSSIHFFFIFSCTKINHLCLTFSELVQCVHLASIPYNNCGVYNIWTWSSHPVNRSYLWKYNLLIFSGTMFYFKTLTNIFKKSRLQTSDYSIPDFPNIRLSIVRLSKLQTFKKSDFPNIKLRQTSEFTNVKYSVFIQLILYTL